jgi:hypothetical protein
MRYHGYRQYHKEVMADIQQSRRHRIGRFETTNLPNYEHQLFYWHQGRAFRAYLHPEGGVLDEEMAYIHFQKRSFPVPSPALIHADGFGIGPQGFFPYNREPLTAGQFDQLNHGSWLPYRKIYEALAGRAARKISWFFGRP